jgi:O-antigen/teichoic acid export membrane protein
VATVLLPEVSRRHQAGDLEGVGRLWQQAMARLALVVLPLFAFLFCFAEPLLLAYLSDPYRRSLWVFRLFLLVLPLRIAVYNPLLVGIGRATWALWASVADLLLNLLLSLALVHLLQARQPAWAFLGPALAAVCSTYVQVGVLLVLIAGRLRLGLAGLLPWATLLRVGAAAAAAALLSLGAAALLSGPWARLGVGGAAFAALMLAALWLHPADRREVAEIGRALRRG